MHQRQVINCEGEPLKRDEEDTSSSTRASTGGAATEANGSAAAIDGQTPVAGSAGSSAGTSRSHAGAQAVTLTTLSTGGPLRDGKAKAVSQTAVADDEALAKSRQDVQAVRGKDQVLEDLRTARLLQEELNSTPVLSADEQMAQMLQRQELEGHTAAQLSTGLAWPSQERERCSGCGIYVDITELFEHQQHCAYTQRFLQEEHAMCEICGQGDRPSTLLLCDGLPNRSCSKAYHMHCHRPPMKSKPKGKWHCPSCRNYPKARRELEALAGYANFLGKEMKDFTVAQLSSAGGIDVWHQRFVSMGLEVAETAVKEAAEAAAAVEAAQLANAAPPQKARVRKTISASMPPAVASNQRTNSRRAAASSVPAAPKLEDCPPGSYVLAPRQDGSRHFSSWARVVSHYPRGAKYFGYLEVQVDGEDSGPLSLEKLQKRNPPGATLVRTATEMHEAQEADGEAATSAPAPSDDSSDMLAMEKEATSVDAAAEEASEEATADAAAEEAADEAAATGVADDAAVEAPAEEARKEDDVIVDEAGPSSIVAHPAIDEQSTDVPSLNQARPSIHDRVRVHWSSGEAYDGIVVDTSEQLDGQRIIFRFRVKYDDDQSGASGGTVWHIHGAGGDVQVEQRPPEAFQDVMESGWQQLKLTCAISHERLTEPAKGSSCAHVACCNITPLRNAVARLSKAKVCPVFGCNVKLSRARDVVSDTALTDQLRAVPATAQVVWLRAGEVRWEDPLLSRAGQEPSAKRQRGNEPVDVDLEGATVIVDEERRIWWARQITHIKSEG